MAAAAGAAAAVFYFIDKKKKEQEQLDWYLLGDQYRNPAAPREEGLSLLQKDLNSWKILNQEDQDVTLSFTFDDPAIAKEFMNDLASNGISSMLDEGNGIVDVLIAGSVDSGDLDEIIEFISVSSEARNGGYQGYVFDY